ncbi:zinc finger CCHC domain-containing protein 8 homolog [Drosophila persimilis]|uniref:Zinc finger CCHC domain-containing protein 8 homolog n=1 Tax=Drosophila pseudoobscura pseudoobscura TaxID=46245 RepID=A0A6I8UWF5_DROPS|nr:zinc finger CCHC domain-containing protein 8 homolog [Drosophila pseudoobscura]XP_026841668.1 zinc finger CCHC domain-containing protein 8 homolog [Drosophila persimilis]
MDDSVIVLDDTQPSGEIIEVDVEDGELDDSEIVVVAAADTRPSTDKLPTTDDNPSLRTQENNQNEADGLVFEVKFCNKEHFASLHHKMLDVLGAGFVGRHLDYRTNVEELVIGAFDGGVMQPQSPSSPDLDTSNVFMIDTSPAPKLMVSQVPSYKRSNTDVLDEDTEARKKLKAEAVNKCIRPKNQSACFNCGETGHSLRECPQPRNNVRIQRARKKISYRMERYHVDIEQRFGHLRPGKISTKTRHAMGYNRNELPFMFYRLRVLGYPPAWLEDAKMQSSGISIFNADGTEVSKSDDEEGVANTFKYDLNKIVEFPGFNVEPGGRFFDDFQHHNVPPFQKSQLKENFIKSLGENISKGYRRKKLLDLPAPHDSSPTTTEKTNFVEYDMDVEEAEESGHPPLPASEPNSISLPPPPPPLQEKKEARSQSPSIEDLKAQQEKLLLQLESNTSLDTSSITADESISQTTLTQTQSAPTTPSGTRDLASRQFKATFEGTPILKFSEFNQLPVDSNFRVGVSDVIHFDNLPDSTGKYEQMKDLLKNVREKMVKLQNED